MLYKYKKEKRKTGKCLALSLPLTLNYVLLQHTLQSTPRITNLKNQSKIVSNIIRFEHTPAMRLAIKRKKYRKKKLFSSEFSSVIDSPRNCQPLSQIHPSANCLLAPHCKERETARGYVLRRQITGQR